MKINFRIIFTILFLFFFGVNLTYSNGTGTTENINTETTNKITNYFLVDDVNINFNGFQNYEKKNITFKNGDSIFGGIKYFFSDDIGGNYIVDSDGYIRSLTESNFSKAPYYYNGLYSTLNYGNNLYYLETKDYVIIVKQNEIKYSIYENGRARISIYSKKYRDFLTFNLDLILYKNEDSFIEMRDNKRKRQLLNNISVKNDILIFTESINIGIGERGKGFIKYELNLNTIPEQYFNNFFEYRMVLHHSKTLNPNNYLDDVLLGKRDFDFQDYMLLGPDSFFPSFYKVDNMHILNSDDLKGTDGESFFKVTRVFGVYFDAYIGDHSGIIGSPFITLKNNGFAIIKNNYILYNKDNNILGYIYFNGKSYKNENIGSYFDNVISNYQSLKLSYLPKTKQYVLSYVKDRFGKLTGHTVVVSEDKLFNVEGKQEYNGIYYVGSGKNNENVFITDNLLNKYYKDTEVNNNLTFYTLSNYKGKTHLVKSTDGYGRVSDQPVFDYVLDGVNNNGFYVDPITGQNNNNVGNINKDGGYTDDDYRKEKEREQAEQNSKKEILEKASGYLMSLLPDGIFTPFTIIIFDDNFGKNLKIPFLMPKIIDGKAKIDMEILDTKLKPIEDKLNISLVDETPGYLKTGLSYFLGLFYVSIRIGIVFLSFIFLKYIYSYLESIIKLYFSDSLKSKGNSNLVGGFTTIGFFLILFAFSVTILIYFNTLNPLFAYMIEFLDVIFGFFIKNFLDFSAFKTFVNTFTVGIFGLLFFYLVKIFIVKFGKPI